MTKQNVATSIIAAVVVIMGVIFGLNANEQKFALENALQFIDSHSGYITQLVVITNPEVLTGEVLVEEVLVEEVAPSVRTLDECFVGEQPTENPNNYEGNTKVLNDWATNNNCEFLQDSNLEDVKFIVTLTKPTVVDNQVHMWFKDQNAYGRLISNKGDQVLVFEANSIKTRQQDTGKELNFDLAKALSKGDISIQSYSASFDGNYIESIALIRQQ